MITKRHLFFNIIIIVFPWLSLFLLGKRSIKRFSIAGIFIVIFEILNHIYGHRRNWWKFYDHHKSFIKDELPFSIGPYMPVSMWMLKLSYGNFKKYVLLNVIADGLFAFVLIDILKKLKIISLNGLNHLQFFIYLHYKAYLLYGVQYLVEKMSRFRYLY
ncbi:hypothetical protein [Bacillus rubiinfantis]|uniref:hypothetical protein n=1 Tax=Bacillus rubiinfantis TaxID=1499680 RepID=UPI0005A64046|nr:hypothetical protein [Bacillus rubiinfantis]